MRAKKYNYLPIYLVVSCWICFSCQPKKKMINSSDPQIHSNVTKQSSDDDIRACFDGYKNAILIDQGALAATYVDSRTLKYYADILEKSKFADSTQINKSSIMDKLMILTIRHKAPPEDLRTFNGQKLLIYAIDQGMVGKNSVSGSDIGEINIDENFAKAQLLTNGISTPYHHHFYKEGDAWKIDLTALFPTANIAFKKMADGSGKDENTFIFEILEMLSGVAPDSSIWNPIEKR